MLTTTEIAGFAGAGLAGAAYIPQISHIIRARCSAGISRLAFEVWLLASFLTTARAIAIHAGVFIATGLRVRVLSHGRGPAVVLLHGASESAAIWAPLFAELGQFRLLAVDLPGHGLSDPVAFRRGQVREHAHRLIEDILDALGLDQVPVVGHSLGGMFARSWDSDGIVFPWKP